MTRQPVPFGSGDRLSDFTLADQRGQALSYYGSVSGRPAVVLFCAGDGRETIRALAHRQQELLEAGAEIYAVTNQLPSRNASLAEDSGAAFPILSDTKERFVRAYCGAAGHSGREIAFLVDANQRVMSVLGDAGIADRAIEELCERPVPGMSAPVLMVPRVFDRELCDDLIGLWRTSNEEIGLSTPEGDVRDDAAKRSRDHVIRNPEMNRTVSNLIARRIGPEMKRAFGCRQEFDFEVHIVIGYDADRQDFFGLHRDNLGERMAHRRFAVSLNLNDGYAGGELRFPEYGDTGYRFPAGTAAVFNCSLLHQALPPTSGQRFVLTTFLCDPEA